MKRRRTIREAINRKFPMINIDDNLENALSLMKSSNVSVLAVKLEKELAGLVTISDVMYSLAQEFNLEKTRISDIMTKCEFNTTKETRNPCVQLDEDEDALAAIKVMYESGVNHLLVSGTDGSAVGIVSSLDIIKLLAD